MKKKKRLKKKVAKTRKKTVKKAKKKKIVKKAKLRTVKTNKKAVKQTASMKVVASGASLEEIGVVTHYFPHVEAAVVKITKGSLTIGDEIVIKGHTTDFKEKVDSMQLEHVPVTSASIGQEIGLKVKTKVRDRDLVYKIVS